MTLSIFVCNPEESYMLQMGLDQDREERKMELEADLDHEAELAVDEFNAFGPDDSQDNGIDEPDHDANVPDEFVPEHEWPWYANPAFEVQEPEIIEA